MERAYTQLENEQWTEARRSFERELAALPKNLEARYNLALLLSRAGHPDQELALYEKNMAYGWHLPTVVNLAAVYDSSGKTAQAKSLLEKAAKRFRNEATLLYLLADIEEKGGNSDRAAQWYQKALRIDPLNGFAHIRYARFLAIHNDLDLALKHAERAIRLQPSCPSCLNILADVQTRRKDYDGALASYQKSLAMKPDPETRQHLIDTLRLLGKHDRATQMQRALDAWLKHHSS